MQRPDKVLQSIALRGTGAWLSGHISPIFILSPPRSGSTFLFECLRRTENFIAPGQESDHIWWQLFPYRPPDFSDFVGAEQVTPRNVRALRRRLLHRAVRVYLREHAPAWRALAAILSRPGRYYLLDKTIANCFHLEFLERAYPEARYIFLVRDPRPTISSMMEGWQYPQMMGKPQLTPYIPPGARISVWNYPAPPGWQAQTTRPLVEICAWSWQQYIEYALPFAEAHPETTAWLRYEDLVADPAASLRRVSAAMNLPLSRATLEYAARRPHSRTTISAPDAEKWRRLHGAEIESIIPFIRESAARLGYSL